MNILPLIFAGVFLAFERKEWLLGAVVAAVGLALNLSANHFQITYYAALSIGAVAIAYLVQAIRTKTMPDYAK